MSNLRAVLNTILDGARIIIIFAVCLIIAVIGSYLAALWIGLVPEGTEYYRPVSIDTVLYDIPFIGTNMIYIIAFLLVLCLVYVAAWGYKRYVAEKEPVTEKGPEKPVTETGSEKPSTEKVPEKPAVQPEAKQ